MEGLETGNESSQVMVSLSLFYLKRIIIIIIFFGSLLPRGLFLSLQ